MLIESAHLSVREFRETDVRDLHTILGDPAVMQFIEPPFSLKQTKSFLSAVGLCRPPRIYAVIWKQSSELIGQLIWHPWDDSSMELGWILRQDYWGRGLAGELTAAMLPLAEKDIVIECSPKQAVTRHIAESFGFALSEKTSDLAIYRFRKDP